MGILALGGKATSSILPDLVNEVDEATERQSQNKTSSTASESRGTMG